MAKSLDVGHLMALFKSFTVVGHKKKKKDLGG